MIGYVTSTLGARIAFYDCVDCYLCLNSSLHRIVVYYFYSQIVHHPNCDVMSTVLISYTKSGHNSKMMGKNINKKSYDMIQTFLL